MHEPIDRQRPADEAAAEAELWTLVDSPAEAVAVIRSADRMSATLTAIELAARDGDLAEIRRLLDDLQAWALDAAAGGD